MAHKTLIIETSPILGRMSGIGHNTLELIKALDNSLEGNEIEVVLAVPFDRVAELKKKVPPGYRIKRIPIPIVIYNLLGKINLVPPLDLFLGKGIYLFPNYRNTKLLFSKSLTYIYDVSFLLFPEFVSPKNKRYLVKNMDRWVSRADRILTISKSSKVGIIKHMNVPESKISIVPCGVDMSVFSPQPETKVTRAKKKYGIAGNYIIYVSNIEPRKNLVRLIMAYRQVYDKHPSISLLIIGGDGWQNEEINAEIDGSQAAGYPIIKPSEYVPDADLPALYSGATMLVHPALYEGFGISPLQAMACGTPVIVANNSSMPEVVGAAGLYVHEADVNDIASKIEELLNDRRLQDKLSAKGLVRAQQFSWRQSALALVNTVKEVGDR